MGMLTWKQASADYEKKSAGSNAASTTPPTSGMISWKQAADEFGRYDKDGYKALGQKRISDRELEKTQRAERASVSDWMNRYNSIMQGVSDYDKKRNGGYTQDASGGYGRGIESLIADYEGIKGYAGQYGLQNPQKYLDQLKQLQESISQINESFSQFDDEAEYGRYMDYVKDLDEKRNLDLDAYSQEIARLEEQLKNYDPQIDWTDAAQRKQYDTGLKELESEINQRKQYLSHARQLQDLDALEEEDIPELERYIQNRKAARVQSFNQALTSLPASYEDSYLIEKYGRAKLDQIAESYQRKQNAQGYQDAVTAGQTAAGKSKTVSSALSVGANLAGNLLSPLSRIADGGYSTGRYETMDPYSAGDQAYAWASGVRGKISTDLSGDEYDESGVKVKDGGAMRQLNAYAYQGLMSGLDSGARAIVGGSSGVAMGLAAMGSFNQTLTEASEKGASFGEAMALATANAGIEAMTEKIGLDELFHVAEAGKKPLKQVIRNVLKQAGVEAAEEELSLIGSLLAEAVILKEKSGYNQQIAQLMADGMTEADARKHANLDILKEAGETFLVSAFSGGISGGGAEVYARAVDGIGSRDGKATAETNNATELASNSTPELSNATEIAGKSTPLPGNATADNTEALTEQPAATVAENATTEKSSAVDDKMSATESTVVKTSGKDESSAVKVGVSKMETVHMTEDLDSFAQQFGTQAEAVRRNYLDGQDLQEYEVGFQTAYAIGLESGKEEALSNVPYLSQSQKDIAFSMGRDAAAAQTAGIEEAYRYGSHGYGMDQLKQHGTDAAVLADDQMQEAYNAGLEARQKAAEPVSAQNVPTDTGVYLDGGSGNVTVLSKKDLKGLTGKRKAGVQAAVALQKLGIGGNFYFYESYVNDAGDRVYKDADGIEKTAPNGWYDPKDDSIHIDLNAGSDGSGLTLFTLSHELTHHIERRSKQKYQDLATFLAESYGKQGESVDALVMVKQKELGEIRGEEVSYDEAYSEFIADSMEAMLSDGNVLEKLTQMKNKDRNLFDSIRKFFEDLARKIREIYSGMQPDSYEGRAVLQMQNQIEQIQQLFAEALVDASENYAASAQIGLEVDADTESIAPAIQHSERTWKESDYVKQRNQAAKEISEAIGVSMKKATAYIDSVNSIAKMIAEDRTRLDYFSSPHRSSFVSNVEYGGSFDFSTLCKKRRLLTGTFTAIQKALPNTALTADEILDIRNRMKDAGLEVSCGLCYVEGSRANMGQFAKEFLRLYKQYYPDAWQPNMVDVNTPDGIEWVRINHPECYEQYEYFWNHYGTLKPGDKNLFASQQKPKLYQLHTEYKGEILQKFKDDDNVEEKNLNGGIRLQSFSDFEIVHLIDTMQIIMDMSRVGLAGQAYTKVPDFAWALGDTGLKINLSLIAKDVDANGKLIFDDIEGMPIAEAMRLRDRYSANVGTILVAFNDAQLMAAMADDRVDFIIPFHRSQWKKSQYEAMGLPAKTKDYTYMQNEKFIKPQYHEYRGRMVKDKATNYMPNEYWDFNKSGKGNAVAYLEMCARNNKRPKFYKLLQNNGDGSYSLKADGSTDGYWKLLIDFKMYDNDGNGSPQMAVKPEFNMEEAARMMREYKGGHSSFPVAQGIVDDFVKEYKQKHDGRQFSDRKKAVDNSALREENDNRGDNYDNRRIRKGTEAGTAGAGYDGRADSGRVGHAPETSDWGSLDREVKRKVRSVIKTHLNSSPNINEALAVIYSFVGRTDETITPYTDRKAMDILAEKLYTAALSDHPVVFESNWAFLGGNVSSLQKSIRNTMGDSSVQKQDRSTSTSNRALLAGAFEELVSSPDELQFIRKYQENIELLNEQETKLQELRQQIREISFGKGPRDSTRLAQLQDEATKTANRIDVYDKKLLKLERAKPLRDVLDREREKVRKATRQKGQEAMAEYREKRRDSAARKEAKQKIRKAVMDLDKLLNRGDKKKNVKDGMNAMVSSSLKLADALFMDEYSNRDMLRNGVSVELTDAEERLFQEAHQLLENIESGAALNGMEFSDEIAAMEQMKKLDGKLSSKMAGLKDVFARERKRLYGTTVSDLIGKLAEEYSRLSDAEDGAIRAAKDENVYAHLLQLQKDVGGTTVRDMSLAQMEMVADAYTMVLTTVRNANKMFAKNLQFKRDTLAGMVMGEIGSAAKKLSKLVKPGKNLADSFSWNNLKPVYAFERLGSDTLKTLFGNIRKGQDVWAKDMQEADAFRMEQYRKHSHKSWDPEKLHSFEFESGKVELSLEQIMSLYAYSRREAAMDHLLKGGFVFGRNTEVTVKENGIRRRYLKKDATAYNLTADELLQVIDTLTDDQKAFVAEMQTYLSDVMGGKGNEVSLQMYGIRSFGEKNYFPIRSAGQYMEKAKEDSFRKEHGQISIVNSGFTKATTPHASNPITLDGFMDVWSEHVNEMAMYHGFVLPMEDFRRVYNYSSPNVEEGNSKSVNAAIENAFGAAATGYIDQLYKDLNGGAVSDSRENIGKRLVSLHKKAAVFASASVVVQQPTAIVRAFALMDPSYFIGPKVDKKRHQQLWAELKQYAPVAFVKEMGYFDTGMGRSAKDYLQAEEYSGIREKMAALFTDADYRDEILGKAPALADELTWCVIWESVKRETKAKNRNLDVKSAEFLQLAGDRFSEVIDKTQVYDSVLSRSANMRSKSLHMNMLTSFMAEPTTSINMLEDALRKGDKHQIRRTAGAVYGSVLLNSLLVSLVYAARDDDEDETFWEKYLASVATEMLDGLNPITYYPFLKDIWSIGQGYDVERADMSLITDLANAAKAVVSGIKAVQEADDDNRQEALGQLKDSLWGMTDSIASLTGLPVKNIRRDIEGARSMYQTISKDLAGRKTTDLSLQDAVLADVMNAIPIGNLLYEKSKRDRLYQAITAGDNAYIQRLKAGYETESSYHSALRLALRDHDSRIWEAAVAWNDGNLERYKTLALDIIGEGFFIQDDVVMAIRAEASSMEENQGESGTTIKGIFTNEKFGVAMSQGNTSMSDYIRQDLINTKVANGKTQEEAEESVQSTARSQLKELFSAGSISETDAKKMLVRYGGYDSQDAADRVAEWKYELDYPELEGQVTYSQYKRWETDGKSRGLPLETFTDVVEFRGGNTSAGVRSQDEVAAYINRMAISTVQKDALWCCFWSESTLYKNAPWHN